MRLRTILLILLDTGVRATELATLKMENVDLQGGTIKVTGKGNKDRYVPIGEMTVDQLPRQCGVDADIAITRTETISPWVPGPSIVIPNIPQVGAIVPQDTAAGSACEVIGVGIIQAQSVLRP
jgi:hypothetical protein